MVRRLGHLADLCAKGLVASAELELHAWRREADCPAAATALLAALLAQRGQPEAASRLLQAVHESPDARLDPHQAALLVGVMIERGQGDAARRLAERLTAGHVDDPAVRGYLAALGYDDLAAGVSHREAARLADRVVARPALLNALVSATLCRDDADESHAEWGTREPGLAGRGDAATLARAGRAAIDRLDASPDRASVCLAMARLARADGRPDDVRRWAHLGLRADAYEPRLALMLAGVDDDPTAGPAARQAIARVLRRHPHYPDLRAAYIRRCRRDGRSASARRRLAAWLRRDPRSPLAIELQQEQEALA
jgi:hypothetical protein